ncbi:MULTISPECIES: hypothetical protein [unclassified Pseudoalteromonas]|uniref:hypothetical protein n=1 Tax=unclassified Pseudoalteromonas TaxID=194690 RepID=UPI0010238D8B|nr:MULTISPECIES: hypothetical protein [unclassified Pseudoalteromonas]MCF2829600.1 hypothetical protein [Pseudoalteromonas sp. OF5H-5]MCF2830856.1 hypothetical protein [Pseudoalteromonas sp. DL2-H6]MCF2927316.1 hypothetical protein [Pseudoalteromonas sp. DL2-H1]RZG17395.1 hypothetical protein EXT47_02770 [Pseudoalteromonas sp. CO342X]
MSKTAGPSIYIPTDKNIYDALKHKKVTQCELVSFLRKRGVLVSNNAPKQQLIEKICSLTMGYEDFKWIGKLLENPNKKDKTTHSKLKGDVELPQIKIACDAVKAQVTSGSDDSVKVTKLGNTTTLKVTYVDHDFTKTELRQRTVKTCEIQIEQGADGVVMKYPSTKKAKEITGQLKKALAEQVNKDTGTELEELVISLEALTDAEVRSGFFDYLIRNVPGFNFDTVTNVDVYHLEQDKLDELNDDGDSEARLASYINKAALAGAGVLESSEFKQLHKKGFYIYRIIWTAIDTAFEGAKVEFEAQFGNPKICKDFMYTVRGTYPYNSRTQDYNVTRKAATPHENEKYNMKLRDTSENAVKFAVSKYGV